MGKEQKQFLVDEFLMSSIIAALARSKTYNSDATDKKRKDLRKKLRINLKELAIQYHNNIDNETHICNIKKLANEISSQFRDILRNGQFRIGCAQKALNLYLKYLWCIGEIKEPPHCPFDSFIISKIREYNGPKWPEINTINEYQTLVEQARKAARNESLAKWELRLYNENQRNDP